MPESNLFLLWFSLKKKMALTVWHKHDLLYLWESTEPNPYHDGSSFLSIWLALESPWKHSFGCVYEIAPRNG